MTLVDTSVWVDHLRRGDSRLAALLESAAVLVHPFVIGEIACGNLRDRAAILELMQALPMAIAAEPDEILVYVDRYRLYGQGIGYVDVSLLASVALTDGATLWSRDRRLQSIADKLGLAFDEASLG